MKKEICCICNTNPVIKNKASSSLVCQACKQIHDHRIKMAKTDPNWTANNPLVINQKIK